MSVITQEPAIAKSADETFSSLEKTLASLGSIEVADRIALSIEAAMRDSLETNPDWVLSCFGGRYGQPP